MTTARTIKRYANRKLYDTRDSRYVTLDHIAAMVRAGDDVRVVDNTTRADLTTATLAQIIFEEEKKTPRLSVAGLRHAPCETVCPVVATTTSSEGINQQ